ncbi:MAG: peptidoglycan-binding domain-containing protein [Gemmatimonadaceae bacterium]|jgi:peptidoglycan hydrolase-like protein with peptidoglycan-binding domain
MKKTIAVIALIAAPALASAQAGLSKIQFLALQQELRDQGCGVTNVDGHYGPQTRRAIATCAKKFNSANNAAALLTAMNIGFGPNDNPPAGKTAENSSGGSVASEAKAEGESKKTEAKEVKAAHHAKKKVAAK